MKIFKADKPRVDALVPMLNKSALYTKILEGLKASLFAVIENQILKLVCANLQNNIITLPEQVFTMD